MIVAKLNTTNHRQRQGAVLLVVLAMLALFAVIGLTFVFYAESRATAARIYRETQDLNAFPDPPDAQAAALAAMSQLIYDAPDGPTGVFTALRGHSLSRGMYGQWYEVDRNNPATAMDQPVFTFNTNSMPYAGIGHVPGQTVTTPTGTTPIVNYTWASGTPVVDPERTGFRVLPTDLPSVNSRYISKAVSSTYPDSNDMAIALVNPINGQMLTPSFHRDWIFNPAPAAANEFARQMTLAPPTVNPANTDWITPAGRQKIIRPRPNDHIFGGTTEFPYPTRNADGTYTGDVQNIKGSVYPYLNGAGQALDNNGAVWAPGTTPRLIPKNDSVWIDTGAPVQIWNGKRVKPLFAFTVVPTNNKVNLNASGNMRGQETAATNPILEKHDSGMGLNAREINPRAVMINDVPTSLIEYQRMKYHQYGSAQAAYPTVNVRPDTSTIPVTLGTKLPPPPGTAIIDALYDHTLPPNAYAAFDWDGGASPSAMRMLLPGQRGIFGLTPIPLTNSAFALAPRFVAPQNYSRYGNGDIGNPLGESANNPYLWNSYLWKSALTTGRLLPFSDLKTLHQKWSDDTGVTNNTQLGKLAPFSFGNAIPRTPSRNPANRSRFNVTTISNSLSGHSMMPQTASLLGSATAPNPVHSPYLWLNGPGLPPVPVSTDANSIPNPITNNALYGPQNLTDFGYALPWPGNAPTPAVLGRGEISNMPVLDLNRPLPDYRHKLALFVQAAIQNEPTISVNLKYLPLTPANIILPVRDATEYLNWLGKNQLAVAGVPLAGVPAFATVQPLMAFGATALDVQNQQLESLRAASIARQEMARDIFARLVIATGASGMYMPANGYCLPVMSTFPAPPTFPLNAADVPRYDALRYLAQLAANTVDYIDGDDIVTNFVWNPTDPTLPTDQIIFGATSIPNFTASTPGGNHDRVALGCEKPKLVVNEGYSELTNVEADTTNANGTALEARFWLELMNPNPNDVVHANEVPPFNKNTILPPTSVTNPMSDAVLYYVDTDQTQRAGITLAPFNAFTIDIYRDSTSLNVLSNRGNPLGLLPNPDSQVNFVNTIGNATIAATGTPPADPNLARQTGYVDSGNILRTLNNTKYGNPYIPKKIGPVGTKYRPQGFLPASTVNPVDEGYLVLGPAGQNPQPEEFHPVQWADQMGATPPNYTVPPTTPAVFNAAVMIPNSLQLPVAGGALPPVPIEAGIDALAIATRPSVVVKRLTNPYMPLNDPVLASYDPTLPVNTYQVIDFMQNVKVNDAVRAGSNSGTLGPTRNRPTNTPAVASRESWIKRHPFSTLCKNMQFDPAAAPPVAPPTGFPKESLFRHNGQNTALDAIPNPEHSVALPEIPATAGLADRALLGADVNLLIKAQGGGRNGFEWLVHMDRPLVNQLELLQVPAVPQHLLTNSFITLDAVSTPFYHQHLAAWTDSTYIVAGVPPVSVLANSTKLYRALELLRVKPWTYATPLGGRVAGQININCVTDHQVLLALADAQSGDFFKNRLADTDPTAGYPFDAIVDEANLTNPATVFGKLLASRHGATPRFSQQYNPETNTIVNSHIPYAGDRPFRGLGNAFTGANPPSFVNPSAGANQTILGSLTFDLPLQTHPYVQQSLARKIFNNVTTTSDTFEVYLTVGFFEVRNAGPYYVDVGGGVYNTPILGKEIFREAPGDLRQRFFSVVDRTNLCLDPNPTGQAGLTDTAGAIVNRFVNKNQGQRPFFTELIDLVNDPILPLPAPVTATMSFRATGAGGGSILMQYGQEPTDSDILISPNSLLKIGTGSTAEWVRVIAVAGFDTTTGIATVSVQRNTSIPFPVPTLPLLPVASALPFLPVHPRYSVVTNAQLGNPGPQPNFNPVMPNYKAVMPFFERID
jgi:hypothetical protein